MTKRKILVVTFAPIVRDLGGPASAALGVARSLHDQGRLAGVVSPGFDADDIGIPADRLHSPPHPLLLRILDRVLAMMDSYWGGHQRRLREIIFDFFLSRSRVLREAGAVLFLKPGFPRSARSAAGFSIPTFVWASILHPAFNRDQVLEQRQIWGVEGGSAYTDEKRISRLEKFFHTVDHILLGSRVAMRSFIDGGVAEEKIRLLEENFAIDCDRFSPSPKSRDDGVFRVLHVSQMNLIKGTGYLLRAWSDLELERAELVLVGSMEPGVVTLCDRIAPPSTLRLGFSNEVARHYKEADLFVSPSVADLHPYTVLEAMASGTPVIVSDRCGVSAVVENGVNGFLYPHDDIESLEEKIRWCYEHPDALKRMGTAAREKATGCGRSRFSERVIGEIDRCIDSGPADTGNFRGPS